jgi:poly(A) polymerase
VPALGGSLVLRALIALAIEAPAPDALLRLGALLAGGPAEAVELAERLRLSRAERARLVAMREASPLVTLEQDAKAARRALYRLGAQRVSDLLRLAWARRQAADPAFDAAGARELLAVAAAWRAPAFPVKGRDALALGAAPGAAVGDLLAQVEAWWVDADFRPSREDCLARLRAAKAGVNRP